MIFNRLLQIVLILALIFLLYYFLSLGIVGRQQYQMIDAYHLQTELSLLENSLKAAQIEYVENLNYYKTESEKVSSSDDYSSYLKNEYLNYLKFRYEKQILPANISSIEKLNYEIDHLKQKLNYCN